MADTLKGKVQKIIDDGVNVSLNSVILGGNDVIGIVKSDGSSISQSLTRTADTTAYAIGDVIGNATTSIWTFANVLGANGGHFFIVGASLKIAVNAVPSGMSSFRLHIYNASPTNIADNAAFNVSSADLAKYLGYIEFTTPTDLGDNLFSQVDNINKKLKLATGATSIYAMLETRGAFTPSSACIKTITLECVGC